MNFVNIYYTCSEQQEKNRKIVSGYVCITEKLATLGKESKGGKPDECDIYTKI